jgi:hypothetical protein
MNFIFEIFEKILSAYLKAREDDNKTIRNLIYLGLVLFVITISTAIIGNIVYPEKVYKFENGIVFFTSLFFFCITTIILLIPVVYYDNLDKEKKEELISEQEKKVAENPHEPKLAWDLARNKLENYLNRNIAQIKSIFYLSVFAMLVGFGLIIYGAIMVFQKPANFQASLVVAISGLVVNFIGATFLVIYKSTMEQAKDYVNVLERINAVGMSVQIIESINDSHLQIKEETKAELSKKLIDLYSEKK